MQWPKVTRTVPYERNYVHGWVIFIYLVTIMNEIKSLLKYSIPISARGYSQKKKKLDGDVEQSAFQKPFPIYDQTLWYSLPNTWPKIWIPVMLRTFAAGSYREHNLWIDLADRCYW